MPKRRLISRTAKQAGLTPDALAHGAADYAGDVRMRVLDYDETTFQERDLPGPDECRVFRDTATVTWINVDGIHRPDLIERIGEHFRFHPLLLEDIVHAGQRAKSDDYGDHLFVVLNMLRPDAEAGNIAAEQVSLVVGKNFVISFQEKREGDVFDPVRDRIRKDKGRIRKMGADYLAYALIDAIVDNYFAILESVGERIDELEDELISNATRESSRKIHLLKREVLFLRKSVWPLREVINALTRSESALIKPETVLYLRDVYDHTIQVIDTIETFRDVISGMLDVYLSALSYRMNEVMKVLTMIATIFIPLTFIVGVYGMNFEPPGMPELRWAWGYPAVLTLMTAVAVGMLYYFRRKKWL